MMATTAVAGLRAGERLLGSSTYYSDVSEKLSSSSSSDLGFILLPAKNLITAKKSSNYGCGFISNRDNQDTHYIRALKEHVDAVSDPSIIDQWVHGFDHLEPEGSDQEFSVEALLLLQKSLLEKQWNLSTEKTLTTHNPMEKNSKKVYVGGSGKSARRRRIDAQRTISRRFSSNEVGVKKQLKFVISPELLQNRARGYVKGITSDSLLTHTEVVVLSKKIKIGQQLEERKSRLKERLSGIHGGLVHLKGLKKLEGLNLNCCNCITDTDMKPLSDLTNLKELQISCSKVTDHGVTFLKGLHKLELLNMELCPITAACLDSLSDLGALLYLNASKSKLTGDGCEKFSKMKSLKVLNLGFNDVSGAVLAHLKGLINLESLNLDSCGIRDEGLVHLAGLNRLKCLELSDTQVGNNGLRHLSGLVNLESLNLSFTVITDGGLRYLAKMSSLRSLNLDVCQVTDAGLAALASLTGLTHLDLFCAKITDTGTNHLRNFKKLRSLEICGGGLTDAGVKNIKDLKSLMVLNLSQNSHLTDKSLEFISELTQLVSLNVSSSRVTSTGLKHLTSLKNLKSLSLESTKVTANDIKKLHKSHIPDLVTVRPE